MAFEGLTEKLSAAFKRLRGKGRLTEADVKETMGEVRMALVEALITLPAVVLVVPVYRLIHQRCASDY